VLGLPWPRPDASSESATDTELLWIGHLPVAVFTAPGDEGPMARYVARYGAGLHSVAWTVQDLWGTETIVRRRDIRITGVDLPGRHFFLHPADTSGLLIEFTDTEFEEDPRDGAGLEPAPEPLVPVVGIAWLTVVVRDAEKTAARLSSLLPAERVRGLPAGEPEVESAIDLRVSDVVLRLVSPKRPESRYAQPLESTGERMTAVGLAVADLDASVARLAAQGIGVTHRDGHRAWTDPAATLGLSLEWTDVSAQA
jgi:hypothetical protein